MFIFASSLQRKSFSLGLLLLLVVVVERVTANCNIALNNKKDECLANCIGKYTSSNWFSDSSTTVPTFICDKTVPWLHHYSAHSSEWIPATPPPGTGIHEYAVFEGSNPPCAANGNCPGCQNPSNKHLCSVFVDPATCKVTCPITTDASSTSSSSADGSSDTSNAAVSWRLSSSSLAAAAAATIVLGVTMMN